jgi:DNA repair protein RadC
MIVELTPEERAMVIRSYDQLYQVMGRILAMEDEAGRTREHFWVIGFQSIRQIKYIELVALGSANSVHVNARETFQMAVILNCPWILLVHNHPDGSLTFSTSDKRIAGRLTQAGNLMDIEVVDNLLINDRGEGNYLLGSHLSPKKK